MLNPFLLTYRWAGHPAEECQLNVRSYMFAAKLLDAEPACRCLETWQGAVKDLKVNTWNTSALLGHEGI